MKLGVYHGLRPKHLRSHLDEFAFRFGRRRARRAALHSLLGIMMRARPISDKMLILPDPAE